MPVPTNNSRPSLPYAPTQSLPNNARFDILTTTQRPPSAEMLDAEFNALTDDVNMLAAAINDVQAGSIPGSDEELNANKLIKTDGEGNLSWTLVTNDEIAPAAVVEEKLATQSVTTTKIGDAAVTNAKLALGAVTTDKIDTNAVTSEEIATNAVTTAKILNGNVTEAKLADNAVTTVKIMDSNVTTAKIADTNVTTVKLANSSVTTVKIADNNITTLKIANETVTAAKMSSANAATGTVLTSGAGSAATWSAIPTTGQVLQIVSYTYSKRTDTTGAANMSSFAVPFALTITPLSSNSSIFIYIGTSLASIADSGGYLTMALFKNGTQMVFDNNNGVLFSGYQSSNESYRLECFSRLIIDQNNALNAITYELRGGDAAGHGVILNQSSRLGVITSSSLYAVEVQI